MEKPPHRSARRPGVADEIARQFEMEEERRIEADRLARAEAEIARLSRGMRHTLVGLAILIALIVLAGVGAHFGLLPNPFAKSVPPAAERAAASTKEQPRELSKSRPRTRTAPERVTTWVPAATPPLTAPNLPAAEVHAPLSAPGPVNATAPGSREVPAAPPVPAEPGPSLGARTGNLSASQQPTADFVTARFITTMIPLVRWPSATFPNPDAPFVIGVLDDDAVGRNLTALINEHAPTGRKMTVKVSRDVRDLLGSQAIFIGDFRRTDVPEILAQFAGRSVLSFGASAGFTKQGGMIGFRLVDDKLRFDLNLSAAEREGLQLGPVLLKSADTVIH